MYPQDLQIGQNTCHGSLPQFVSIKLLAELKFRNFEFFFLFLIHFSSVNLFNDKTKSRITSNPACVCLLKGFFAWDQEKEVGAVPHIHSTEAQQRCCCCCQSQQLMGMGKVKTRSESQLMSTAQQRGSQPVWQN